MKECASQNDSVTLKKQKKGDVAGDISTRIPMELDNLRSA